MQKQESLGKTLASMDRQTTFLEWDGKQTTISDFYEDPDDEDCSYSAVYRKMGVE